MMKKGGIFRTISETIKAAFEKFFKNLSVVWPTIFSIIAVILGMALIFLTITLGGIFDIKSMALSEDISAVSWIISSLIVLAIAAILVFTVSFFSSGQIGMFHEALQGRKTTLQTMKKYGKKFYLRMIGVQILSGLIVLGAGLTLFLVYFLSTFINETFSMILGALLLILFILFAVLFSLPPYYLIIGDLRITEAIKKSVRNIWNNYFSFFGILIFFVIVSYLLQRIPIAGNIINLLISEPAKGIAFTKFSSDKK